MDIKRLVDPFTDEFLRIKIINSRRSEAFFAVSQIMLHKTSIWLDTHDAVIYPLDAVYDTPEDVPEDVKSNKRYAGSSKWTIKVDKLLLETSRHGYLYAISASSYSFISLLKHFLPIMNPGSATISLNCMASERVLPGCRYGGGMSAAKAALESDTRVGSSSLCLCCL
ncbi:enoyl-[acyl-carrier-protein] reductase [NADH] 1, chloroplastic-like [Rutidosis leptorrhynchoides]|uniref:enoyl-[acyl-carrier-protein] reductase [NADH] 1, chloroplastic-like n=1 Tax=Rutidosis leptorrhynchoides TaxID=125765 RepID=UPI003A990C2A